MKTILSIFGCCCLSFVGFLVVYAIIWGVWYRLPRGTEEVVDLRQSKQEAPHYVIFCAALANNALGFPGHAYVVWTTDKNSDLIHGDCLGYGPSCGEVILPSLFKPVSGMLDTGAARDNARNLDKLIACVDPATYERSRKLCYNWNPSGFQTGVRDCCAFNRSIAREIGLKTPNTSYIFPQDYISQLKELNRQLKIAPKASSAYSLSLPVTE